jgi:predicted nucleotidyltransferase
MIEDFPFFKILHTLHEQKEYSVRGLAKKTRIGNATAKTYLDYLFSKGIVKRKIVGRTHLYIFDLASFLTRSIKSAISLAEINDSGLVKELISRYSVTSIVLYGSVARGEDDMKSDVDVLLITRNKTKISSLKSERKLRRELTVLSYTLPEWRIKSREDKVFYDRIIVEGVPLYGEIPMIT